MGFNAQKPEIPPGALKVFQGAVWSVWQWQQKMNDGSFQTFEILERSDAATCIAVRDGKIALLHQIQVPSPEEFLCFPGGQLDSGETPQQAAERELLEEAGCIAGSIELWKVYAPYNRIRYQYHYFIARDCVVSAPLNPDPGETITVEWIGFEDLFVLAQNPRFRHNDLSREFMDMMLNPEKKKAFQKLLGV